MRRVRSGSPKAYPGRRLGHRGIPTVGGQPGAGPLPCEGGHRARRVLRGDGSRLRRRCKVRITSLRLDTGVLDHPGCPNELILDKFAEFSRRRAKHLEAELADLRL